MVIGMGRCKNCNKVIQFPSAQVPHVLCVECSENLNRCIECGKKLINFKF